MTQRARELLQRYRARHYEPFLRGVRGSYLFEIEQVGTWWLSVDDGSIAFDEQRRDADCVIHCSEADFIDIVEGRRNLVTAVLQGRVKVRGDVALAQKFHGLVSTDVERKRGVA